MKRLFAIIAAFAVTVAAVSSCEDNLQEPDDEQTEQPEDPGNQDEPDTPKPVVPEEDVTPDPLSGISVDPVKPDADGACTIWFEAIEGTEFVGYTGDVYVHIGIIIDGEWKYVESDWDINNDKFKMTPDGDGKWKLEIANIREFFTLAEPTVPIVKLGMVIRSAEAVELTNEKGEAYTAKLQTRPDQFVSVTDNKNAYVPFQPDEVVNATMPSGLLHGINYTGSNEVTLVFYDKDKNGEHYDWCYAVGDFSDWERKSEFAMKRDEAAGCWWTTITVDDPDKEYRFQYRMSKDDNEIRVQDPYSEIYYHGDDHWITDATYPNLPDYPEGARDYVSAFQIEQEEYSWQNSFSIKNEDDLVIYELLLRDFTETGDLNGAFAKLDYLEGLGINAIELMPVQEFEGNDSWGYAPVGYFALDKAYGTREMYKRFIDECHGRGIAVILDVVYNHTTGSHPWAKLYWNGSDNVSANNPWYNVVTPHGFGVYQDLNHENQMVKEHINRSLVYLLEEYHVDGFRFDLTKGFTNNSGKDNSYDQERVDILTGYYNAIKDANPNAVVILEHFVGDENYELGKRGMKVWQNMNHAYCQSAMGYSSESDFSGLLDYSYNEFGTYVGFMESHDEERMGFKQTAYGNVKANAPKRAAIAPMAVTTDTWGIVGRGGDWDNDLVMTFTNGYFFADNVSFAATDKFKFRANRGWDKNFGFETDGTSAAVGQVNYMTAGGKDMSVAEGTYDVYLLPAPGVAWFLPDGETPGDFFGLVGSINDWGNTKIEDTPLKGNADGYFVAEGVTLAASDEFKIRGNNEWNDRANYGADKAGAIPTNAAYTLTLGASAQNMKVAAGTYDVWFEPIAGKIWVMAEGSAPSDGGNNGGGNTGGDITDDSTVHEIYMRRLGLNAAFFLTVPGPKMIWQFGELGYDLSINYPSGTENDRTSRKPAKWEYRDDPAREALYETYAALLDFRRKNPEFFQSNSGFRWYAGTDEWPGRYLFNEVGSKKMAIFGNFGSGPQTISVELPADGEWYNYFNPEEVWTGANHSPVLKEGEFVFLVNWK
ncbi:MAG: hypothetical protein IJ005_07835 [Bacteroidales bacterium]|nr:hypothetical protein [Bacteroidales bacterium]